MIGVDGPTATVTVGSAEDLLGEGVEVTDLVWAGAPVGGRLGVQCSAHGRVLEADVSVVGDRDVSIRWVQPQRRIAPGQSVVLYEGDEVVGGGIVTG